MQKQLSLFIWAVSLFGMAPLMAATNSGWGHSSTVDLSSAPHRVETNVNYEKYETRSSRTLAAQPKRSDLYKEYDASKSSSIYRGGVRTSSKTETYSHSDKTRKYYLAHPFFQPTKGKFGAFTDLSYATSKYDMKIVPDTGNTIDYDTANWSTRQIALKEDISYGITDTIAAVVMGRFANTKDKIDFANDGPLSEQSESRFDVWGLGAQWRFTDTEEYIAMLSGYYQNYVDAANVFIAELKGGYKVAQTTLYGLGRVWALNMKGDTYGNSIGFAGDNTQILIAHVHHETKQASGYLEAGVGAFSVLDKDWTLNLEGVLGSYDWHSQGTIKAAVGWQPGDMFALNLYVKTAVYDSADGKDVAFYCVGAGCMVNGSPAVAWERLGDAKLSGVGETTFGLQAILYF